MNTSGMWETGSFLLLLSPNYFNKTVRYRVWHAQYMSFSNNQVQK
jgi:hypothetical protein